MSQSSTPESGDRSTLLNALVGAVVSVVLSFLPFSPLVGGAVAGYLERGDDETGLKVGALSGAIAAIPILLIFGIIFGGLTVAALFEGEPAGGALFTGILLVVVLLVLLFVVGVSAVGGLVGAVLYRRSQEDRDRPATATPPADPENDDATPRV